MPVAPAFLDHGMERLRVPLILAKPCCFCQ
jgi:hypothetical protein